MKHEGELKAVEVAPSSLAELELRHTREMQRRMDDEMRELLFQPVPMICDCSPSRSRFMREYGLLSGEVVR